MINCQLMLIVVVVYPLSPRGGGEVRFPAQLETTNAIRPHGLLGCHSNKINPHLMLINHTDIEYIYISFIRITHNYNIDKTTHTLANYQPLLIKMKDMLNV